MISKLRTEIVGPYPDVMTPGKAVPKLVPSFMRRQIRLGVSHAPAPSRWTAPTKETAVAPVERTRPQKKRR